MSTFILSHQYKKWASHLQSTFFDRICKLCDLFSSCAWAMRYVKTLSHRRHTTYLLPVYVSDVGSRSLSPQAANGLSRFSSSVGSVSVRSYADKIGCPDLDDHYFVQVSSFYPGVSSFGGSFAASDATGVHFDHVQSLARCIRGIKILFFESQRTFNFSTNHS